ncbi:MAG: AI-2E family transporter, partial [Elusimicrobia bacterium]|nr:AI-2E family transporter [Elusimicrobiota bacterium]
MTNPSGFAAVNKQMIFRIFFFSVFLFLIFQFLRILSPFFTPIMAAITLVLIFFPLHARIRKQLKDKQSLAAAASTSVLLFIVIVPTILFVWLLVRQAAVIYPWAQERVQAFKAQPTASLGNAFPAPFDRMGTGAERFLSYWEIDLNEIILKNLDQLGTRISAFGTGVVKNVLFFLFDLMVLIFSLFFLFRDGPNIMHKIMDLIPMEQTHKEHILLRLYETLSAVVRGVFITASIQGLLAGLGYTVAGIHFSVLLAFGTAFLAVIPFLGAAAVWVPVAVYLYLKGMVVKSVLLFLWGALVVSLVDNFLKPILIGEKARLP